MPRNHQNILTFDVEDWYHILEMDGCPDRERWGSLESRVAANTEKLLELLETEGVTISFEPDAVDRVAEFATQVNDRSENIGARRLHTIMGKLLDDISFNAPELDEKTIVIDAAYVDRMLADVVSNEDLSRYIL